MSIPENANQIVFQNDNYDFRIKEAANFKRIKWYLAWHFVYFSKSRQLHLKDNNFKVVDQRFKKALWNARNYLGIKLKDLKVRVAIVRWKVKYS